MVAVATRQRDNSPLCIRVLGPIEATVDGRHVDIGPPKRRLLLGLLALEAGQPVPMERLLNLLWETPPPAAKRVIFAHVARLRQALAHATGGQVPLVRTQLGYALHVAPAAVDAHVFRQRVAEAASIEAAGLRAALLREALELWRGPALEDLVVTAIGEPAVRSLEDLRLWAIEDRIEADLATGGHAAAAIELTALVFEHPLRERMAGHLMLALYRCGAAAQALEVYRQVRKTLADELGLDPGPELTALNHAILRRDPVPGGLPKQRWQRLEVPAQLPAAVAGFSGRAVEVRQLDSWRELAATASLAALVATVHGGAGMGKTALAVHWAHRVADQFPDGQLYVNLRADGPAPVTAGDAVRRCLHAFGVERVPADTEALIGLYRTVLAGRRVLVVVDHATHSEQIRPLLPGSPGCAVIITSRQQLTGLVTTEGARPLALTTLHTDESRALLVSRLGRARVAAEPAAVNTIIRRCAGHPLSLAEVAAQAATRPEQPLAELAEMLPGPIRPSDPVPAPEPGDAPSGPGSETTRSPHLVSPSNAGLCELLRQARDRVKPSAVGAGSSGMLTNHRHPLLT